MVNLLTTVLDVAGMLLLVAAVAVGVAVFDVPPVVRGLAVAGVGLLVVSWIVDGAPFPRRKERS